MNAFRLAHAAAPKWTDALDACIEQLGPGSGTLGFVYVGDAFAPHLAVIAEGLRVRTGIADWVGTVGLGVCATGREYFDEPALVVLAGDFEPGAYRLAGHVEDRAGPALAGMDDWLQAAAPAFGVVHLDPRNPRGPALVAELAEAAQAYLVGGLASSRGPHPQLAGRTAEGGMSGVLFSSSVTVAIGLTQGCTPIGPKRTVTAGQDNVVFELDGRPALDAFKEDIGELLARDLSRIGGYIHVALPVRGSDTGDYLVRNLVGIDPDRGWLAVGARLQEGDQLMVCRRDGTSAREDLRRMLRSVRGRAGQAPRGGLYYTCLARGPNLFGPDSAELAILREELGDLPIAGMFCNGEIAHNRLYGYTGVLTLFT